MNPQKSIILILSMCILLLSNVACQNTEANNNMAASQNQSDIDAGDETLDTTNTSTNTNKWLIPLISEYLIDDSSSPPPPPPPPVSDFNIELVFGNTMTPSQIQAFQNAVNRWQSVITGDLSNVTVPTHNCFGNSAHTLTGRTVDDLVIYATFEPIDGPYNIIGSAGPYYLRGSNSLPMSGCLRLDSADVAIMEANGSFEDVILHEIGHILGLGTLWDNLNLDSSCPSGFGFTGTATTNEWSTLGGTGSAPIENLGGGGTQCGHWRESIFDNELMTGWSEGGSVAEPLSRLTVAQFTDLGYTTDLAQADAYSLPTCSGNCSASQQLETQNNVVREELLQPQFIIDENGITFPIIRRAP